jgi:hypothetical protein
MPSMPVISCPDCGRDVSTLASACPHCGRPSPAATAPILPSALPLMGKEETKWSGSPAWTLLAERIAALIASAIAIPLLTYLVAGTAESAEQRGGLITIGWLITAALVLFLGISIATALLLLRATRYTITDQRLLIESGLFSKRVDEIDMRLIDDTLFGTISMDEFAQLHPAFPAVNVQHDWGNVRTKITNASFLWNTLVNNFAIDIKSHFWFEVNDEASYDADYDGVLITLDGNVFAPNGEHYFPVPGAATANIAGYPMQVTSLGVGNSDTGDIWFGFRGDIEPGQMAPTVKDREAKYILKKTSTAELTSPGTPHQVASLDASALGPDQDFGYSTGTAGGVTVQKIHLDFSYPPSSKTVQVTADCMWHQEGSSYFFIGNGQVKVIDSLGIGIDALFGREVSDSYWLVKASIGFSMMALGSTGLGMNKIHGGLGYSVPISAFDMPELIQVKTDKSKAYLFSAGVGVGTMDAFTLYADGTLTVKLGGPDAGVRLSVGAWLLDSEHAYPPLAEACMQYAGGAFDAGMTMHLELGGGLAVIDAPKSGPDICTQAAVQVHFGGSEAWHIWIGQKSLPLTAKLLIIEGKGYLMIDGQGVEMFNGIYVDKQWSASIAGFGGYVKVWGAVEMNGVMTYAPFHVAGGLGGSINAKAGADVAGGCCSVGFGVNLKFAAAAPPVEVCGKVGVHFSTPWPLPDVNANVGPLCLGG